MKRLTKESDWRILFKIRDKETKEIIPLSYYDDYSVTLKDKDDTVIRELTTTNTVEDGTLYEHDTETLKFYIETRDSDNNDYIKAYVKTKAVNSDLSDGDFDKTSYIQTYYFEPLT